MAKRRNYTFEFKLRLVLEIVQGHGSLRTISQNAGVNRRTLTHWVNLYNIHGEEALKWKKVYNRSIEQKIDLVLAYRESNLTLSQAAAQFGLVGADALTTWNNLMKDDKQLTANQFKKKIEASSKSLNNKDYSTLEKEIESKLQELKYLSKEDLINTLRETLAEVAYLKKLKALTLSKLQERIK
ncbi:helix-turn-helix domain-containing protein [Myroides pelagicus]|uniref:helix-turn-helix domain-containing protein n=1 Tax=Myroides pelagicus TaxID=270914 RepID=UPI002DBA57B8|nr:helix-turn-helix domain-containing protein [Myroides pelagicus]MEC4115105.1 helix-turn-helix domain-containing protein [Myroides pelagicus]